MEPLLIDEILDETNQIDITARQKHWLTTEVCLSVCLSVSLCLLYSVLISCVLCSIAR